MEMEWSFFSPPHLFPEGGQWGFYFSCRCSGLLPVLKLGGGSGIPWCPPSFLPPDLPVTMKLLQHRDLRPGSGGSSAFFTTPTLPCRLPARAVPADAGWEWRGAPCSQTRASSAASSLPPAWHPSPLSLRSSIYLSLNTMQLCTFA